LPAFTAKIHECYPYLYKSLSEVVAQGYDSSPCAKVIL